MSFVLSARNMHTYIGLYINIYIAPIQKKERRDLSEHEINNTQIINYIQNKQLATEEQRSGKHEMNKFNVNHGKGGS